MRTLLPALVAIAALAACRGTARRERRPYAEYRAASDSAAALMRADFVARASAGKEARARAVAPAPADAGLFPRSSVTARMGNAHRLESRLIDLLATRTGKLKDVLDVEQELARVREEIDRYEGRLRYLRAHAALSTFTIYVHEPLPIVGRAGSSVMGEALAQAWRNFVDLVALCVRSLGVVLPLGLVALTTWLAVKRRRKLRVPA